MYKTMWKRLFSTKKVPRYIVINKRYQLNPAWQGYEIRDVNELKKEKDRNKIGINVENKK